MTLRIPEKQWQISVKEQPKLGAVIAPTSAASKPSSTP
jgi:hypothetical protein